jgi:hypothetical protein
MQTFPNNGSVNTPEATDTLATIEAPLAAMIFKQFVPGL